MAGKDSATALNWGRQSTYLNNFEYFSRFTVSFFARSSVQLLILDMILPE